MRMLLMSHGQMAQAALGSAELIMGKLDNVKAIGLNPDQGPEDLQKEAEEFLDQGTDKETVVAVDVLGGTPSNVVIRLFAEYPDIQVISGVNLPLIIEFANQSMMGQGLNKPQLIAMAKDGIVDVNAKLK
ncbi:PTS sugar transporter subunit IIA [Lactobacillus sp. ESL0677]|uniref:PTS sugar transporter subunit IIA n=1 Tax=Lactobacillus sp. ESL0677 TaxID=2983208 RepID=UPI0023F8E74D|nr:PTS sugar transporter subunit IIA [Lactobacillus sp. ESL0677]WEV36748.1 PTS sugar transporter subunit IIA [Lactobacillus sp. ESL0677]